MCGARPPSRPTPEPVAASPEPKLRTPTTTQPLADPQARAQRKVAPNIVGSTTDQIGVKNTLGSG